MKFEDSNYFDAFKNTKIIMPFGIYYFCEKFVIAELYESVHFDWEKAGLLVEEVINHYGSDTKLYFISNRINSYSVDPCNWSKVMKQYPTLVIASCIVFYNSLNQSNADLEKRFSKETIISCRSLDEALSIIKEKTI